MRVLVRFNEEYAAVDMTYIDNRSDIMLVDDNGLDSGKSFEYENTLYLSDDRAGEDKDELYVLLPKTVNAVDLVHEAFATGMLDLSMYGKSTIWNPGLDDIIDITQVINKFQVEVPKSMVEAMREV